MKVPFPHILTEPKQSNGFLFRFVTDNFSDNRIIEKVRTQNNPKTDLMESVYNVFEMEAIEERRKAKGDWSKWDKHPEYFKGVGKYIGDQFESNLGTNDFIKK